MKTDKKENTGHWNTGDWNTGDGNTGHWNTGYRNTGKRNTGHLNTGDWNTGHWNTGFCNSITPDECLIFNKPGSRKEWLKADKPDWMFVSLTRWIPESEMTEKEKEAHPSYRTTGGYLKCYTSLKHAYIEAWENASQKDREKTKNLPNFDPDVFEEVFGFQPFKGEEKPSCDGRIVEIDGEKYELIKVEE